MIELILTALLSMMGPFFAAFNAPSATAGWDQAPVLASVKPCVWPNRCGGGSLDV